MRCLATKVRRKLCDVVQQKAHTRDTHTTTQSISLENIRNELNEKTPFSSISFGECIYALRHSHLYVVQMHTHAHILIYRLLHSTRVLMHKAQAHYCELNDKYSHLIGFSFPFYEYSPPLFSGKFE